MSDHINIHGVDVSKIRAGDEVTVRHKVVSVGTVAGVGTVNVWIDYSDGCFPVSDDDVTSHTPAPTPLKVGDRVISGTGFRGRVIAFDGDYAWLVGPADCYRTYVRGEVEKWERIPS